MRYMNVRGNQNIMPMKKTTVTVDTTNLKKTEAKVVAPSEKALNFIRLFARSYYVERSLPLTDNGININ